MGFKKNVKLPRVINVPKIGGLEDCRGRIISQTL